MSVSWWRRSRREKRLRAGLADVDVISLDPRAGWLTVTAALLASHLEPDEDPEALSVLVARPDGTRVRWTLWATDGPGIGSLERTLMVPEAGEDGWTGLVPVEVPDTPEGVEDW